ncbi:NifU-like domain-containing protein [Handroanthus impetiginosus]|uniref:NifU-like domain-containing protein n=1 Tax=Handroanthus impetiginosus TaxID=429701 RepID=A0A2G9IB28_9LAMI|nr:NifU-like domain-containing protein [Handroanthus impetiginosus]
MNATMAVSSPPYAYRCGLHQPLEPTRSPPASAASRFRRPPCPKVSSFFGTRISFPGRGASSHRRYRSLSVSRRTGIKAVATPDSAVELPLTAENVESVLDEIRPYLIADGGNVALHEIDGNVVKLKLQGACGSCPSSVMTMKMGIERRLMEKIPEVVAVESIPDEETGLELNEENIEKVNLSFY